MTYSATLDFDSIFGSAHTCPGCGSADVDMVAGQRDVELRCGSCGSVWHIARAATEPEVAAVP
ncbi:hypothetical protein ABZ942_31100 [Nocardia sp. NPDC046473]|uniref:hypothetical protein n=1 Tax=Nocardia sp. NPDC046473 TaxID=3155733 RepID=UPI0033C1AA68